MNPIKAKIQELVPEVMRLPSYPYNPDAAKAIVALEKLAQKTLWNVPLEETATMYIENYRQQQAGDYRAMFEGRYEGSPITLAVVLQAIKKDSSKSNIFVNQYGIFYSFADTDFKDGSATIVKYRNLGWNLADDNFDHQTPETQAFIGELLGVK